MIVLSEIVQESIKAHAANAALREACGVLIERDERQVYIACRNIAPPPRRHGEQENFIMEPLDYAKAEDLGRVLAIVHSHVGIPPTPTIPDLVACERSNFPWIIVNHPKGTFYQFEPSGYKAPLYGRPWAHELLDCYTFCQDYYYQELGLVLGDYPRVDHWWEKTDPLTEQPYNLYRENFEKEGFVQITGDVVKGDERLQIHDALLMMIGNKVVVEDHAAVMIGDNIIGHHPYGRISTQDVYGGIWRKHTTAVLRHKSLMKVSC